MTLVHGISLTNVIWVLIGAAWVYVLVLGLEADKPLSGDLPGTIKHNPTEKPAYWEDDDWHNGDRLGETASWTLFGAMGMVLFFLLYWAVNMHGRLW